MSKKPTKREIRERQEKADLADTLWCLAVGANGGYWPEDEENGIGVWSTLGCEEMARFMSAVEFRFDVGRKAPKDEDGRVDICLQSATASYQLDEWETLDKLTGYLYGIGVRA